MINIKNIRDILSGNTARSGVSQISQKNVNARMEYSQVIQLEAAKFDRRTR